jgi:hypothetical protein
MKKFGTIQFLFLYRSIYDYELMVDTWSGYVDARINIFFYGWDYYEREYSFQIFFFLWTGLRGGAAARESFSCGGLIAWYIRARLCIVWLGSFTLGPPPWYNSALYSCMTIEWPLAVTLIHPKRMHVYCAVPTKSMCTNYLQISLAYHSQLIRQLRPN